MVQSMLSQEYWTGSTRGVHWSERLAMAYRRRPLRAQGRRPSGTAERMLVTRFEYSRSTTC